MLNICKCLPYVIEMLKKGGGKDIATASLFRNGKNQAVRLPKELEFSGVNEVEVRKEGNSIVITPVRKSWKSFIDEPQADVDFLNERKMRF